MIIVSWLLLGLIVAVAFLTLARIKPEKELQTLTIGLVVAALIYVGFAVTGEASVLRIVTEIAGIGIYSLFAALGMRSSKWWLMLGWMAHPRWGIWLHFANGGAVFTPAWYAIACVSFDSAHSSIYLWFASRINQLEN